MYAWSDVARRTEVVYERAMASPRKDTYERLTRYVPRHTTTGGSQGQVLNQLHTTLAWTGLWSYTVLYHGCTVLVLSLARMV